MKTTDRPTEATNSAATSAVGSSPRLLLPLKPQDFDRAHKLESNVSMAMDALWANRLRSLLTALGIIIGVASVIAAFTMTQGVSANVTNTISSLGTNLIFITPGTNNTTSGGGGVSGGSNGTKRSIGSIAPTGITQSLTQGDAQAITDGPTRIPDVAAVSSVISSANQQVISGSQNWITTVQGVNASFLSIHNWSIEEGNWFSSSDDQAGKLVAVLGQTVYQQLFADIGEDPLGKTILIGNAPYRVVGVLPVQGGASNSDNMIYVPFTTALNRLNNSRYVDQILVQVDDPGNVGTVQQAITSLLEQRHRITKGMADDFNLTTSQQLLQTFNQSISLFTALLVGIASISLTVGGIGIMNIMIVSVTERTREIGLRMSLGAGRQDIRNQFLIEALTLSLVGGTIGLLIGLLLGYGITAGLAIPFVITPISLALPFAVSAGIGVIFGFYPAARAARLDPVVALRSL